MYVNITSYSHFSFRQTRHRFVLSRFLQTKHLTGRRKSVSLVDYLYYGTVAVDLLSHYCSICVVHVWKGGTFCGLQGLGNKGLMTL